MGAKMIFERELRSWREDLDLGVVYELHRDGSKNTVNIRQPFGSSVIANEWPEFAADHIGETTKTYDMIKGEGKFKEQLKWTSVDISYSHCE